MKRTRLASKLAASEVQTEVPENDVQNRKMTAESKELNRDREGGEAPRSKIKQNPPRKVNLTILQDRVRQNEITNSELPSNKTKLRAVVDLKMMKEELKQLEDPPLTVSEKQQCSNRLLYPFFDTPCEQLAQRLLGKILVRRLENGTILKGRIVETEGYLGAIDKASHSYQGKVTPRNVPMYMPPGTVYVYMTYGMYHCFNISSQESGAYVLIRAMEPIVGLDYMELLRNMQLKDNMKEKQLKKDIQRFRASELCNSPYNICTAFVIDQDEFDEKNICVSDSLWIENDPCARSITIVAVPCANADSPIGEGCAVLIRAVEPLEGFEQMADQRNSKAKSKVPKQTSKNLKPHELCNGPSKLCMAFQLEKGHSKYSLCTWKGLWLEDEPEKNEIKIVETKRIGIDSCGPEWADRPLRYYVFGNTSVSKRDKKAEALLEIKD